MREVMEGRWAKGPDAKTKTENERLSQRESEELGERWVIVRHEGGKRQERRGEE